MNSLISIDLHDQMNDEQIYIDMSSNEFSDTTTVNTHDGVGLNTWGEYFVKPVCQKQFETVKVMIQL